MKQPISGLVPEIRLGLATDMYQLTMANGYFEEGKSGEWAVFDLFVRKLPKTRAYLVVAGLEQALHYLLNVNFTDGDIRFLKTLEVFKTARKSFWEYLRDFSFTGDVWAMPEGTIAFAGEPLLSVEGPLIEAQIAETFLLSIFNHQTKIASKSARCVDAARGRPVIEFGMRRTDIGAAAAAARAAYIGGATGTSNVLAGAMFDIPVFGTHAHSWVMSFDSENEAFEAYFRVYGRHTVALIDTYDTLQGARHAAVLGGPIKGVRLDSGDLLSLSKQSRRILDDAGRKSAIIFATNDLNEYRIDELLKKGARIDSFGVGTELVLSADAPSLGCVYKLAQIEKDGKIYPKLKLSKDKSTLPGKKQVYRAYEAGMMDGDIVALRSELDTRCAKRSDIDGRDALMPLLVPVISKGELVYDVPSLENLRKFSTRNREHLPVRFRRTSPCPEYYVSVSRGLDKLRTETIGNIRG